MNMFAVNKSQMFSISWDCVVLCSLCVLCAGDPSTKLSEDLPANSARFLEFAPVTRISRSADVEMSRPVLSTHVLDTSTGKPAVGIFVELYKQRESSWTLWHNTTTTGDGRALFPFTNESMAEGTYKLKFKVGDYYKMLDKETLYPYVEITFSTKDGQHYHIPLLLSPYGYSTYRGS